MSFVKRHKVLTASFGAAAYLGAFGYIVPGVDSGKWTLREQWAYAQQYQDLYQKYIHARNSFERADENGNVSNEEVQMTNAFDSALGLDFKGDPSPEQLQRATRIYKEASEKRHGQDRR